MEIRTGFLLGSFALTLSALATPALADSGQTGIASYYSEGSKTANGERYNSGALTAAHRSLPFNTKVRVTNLRNGRAVVLRINDRGPFVRGRVIDVSRAAANELGFIGNGLTRVNIEVVEATSTVARPTTVAEAQPRKPASRKPTAATATNAHSKSPTIAAGGALALNWRVPSVEEPVY